MVVQDVGVAARLMRRGLGTVVTLDGILFHPSGYISGGQPQASRPFILGYERDWRSIPKEMDASGARLRSPNERWTRFGKGDRSRIRARLR